jgi:fructose-bisphosphate aldolase class I
LARYASICQQAGLVPIVEPEVLVLDGAHDINVSAKVTQDVISACYRELIVQNVLLEGTLLKPNMVLAGKQCPVQPTVEEIAYVTLRVLQNTVPPAVPGIVFLSGGMSEEEASVALNALNNVPGPKPWKLSFSYGRALQATCLKVWQGKVENVPALQRELLVRAKANHEAALGIYKSPSGAAAASDSLYQANYKY